MFTIWKSANNDVCFWYFWIHLTTVQYLYTYKIKFFFFFFLLLYWYFYIYFYIYLFEQSNIPMPIFRRVRLTSRIKSKEKSMLTKKIINSFQQDKYIYIHGRINNKSNTTQAHVIWTVKKY